MVKPCRSRIITGVCWAAGLVLGGLLACRALMHVWWPADIAANLAAQQALVAAGCTAGWLALRRWRFAAFGIVLLGTHAFILADARAPHAAGAGAAGRAVLRCVQFNGSASLGPQSLRTLIADARRPHLLAITEPSNALSALWSGPEPADRPSPAAAHDPLNGDYPHRQRRYAYAALGVNSSSGVMLSIPEQHPAPDVLTDPLQREIAREFMTAVIELPAADGAPASRVCVIAAHPRSPRTARRWRAGRESVGVLVELVRRMRAHDPTLPVVVLADLNSTPSGALDSMLTRPLARGGAGLLRGKPLLRACGTYPVEFPWPLCVAIDDAFVTPGITIIRWQRLGAYGSDHHALLVELALPAKAGASPAR